MDMCGKSCELCGASRESRGPCPCSHPESVHPIHTARLTPAFPSSRRAAAAVAAAAQSCFRSELPFSPRPPPPKSRIKPYTAQHLVQFNTTATPTTPSQQRFRSTTFPSHRSRFLLSFAHHQRFVNFFDASLLRLWAFFYFIFATLPHFQASARKIRKLL